jgi:hypothetical protein
MAVADSVDPDGWMVTFNDLMSRIAAHFGRVEPRRTATAYVRGLLADIDRKNCWNLAEHAGLTGPQAMQRLLRSARWDADAVRDDVRAYVIDQLGHDGVLIVDENGFLKKGAGSAGVQRQYTSTARDGSKTVRSACSWPTPPRGAARCLTGGSTCPNTPGWPTPTAAGRPECPTRPLSPPSPPWPPQ